MGICLNHSSTRVQCNCTAFNGCLAKFLTFFFPCCCYCVYVIRRRRQCTNGFKTKWPKSGALLIGALLRRRGAGGGGGGCHRNAPFVFIVDKIGSARFTHDSQMSGGGTDTRNIVTSKGDFCRPDLKYVYRPLFEFGFFL